MIKSLIKKYALITLIVLFFTTIVIMGSSDYSNSLEKCDEEKGYTCNIFKK